MTETESKVVAAWREAAADLSIRFTAPFIILAADGRHREYLGLVHQFGRPVGTIISVLDEPSERIEHPSGKDYFRSILGSGYGTYKRQLFVDTLDDWQFFGSEAERPGWYSGKSWGS